MRLHIVKRNFIETLDSQTQFDESILGCSEGFGTLIHDIWTPVDQTAIDLH